jgi:hypothetical protein
MTARNQITNPLTMKKLKPSSYLTGGRALFARLLAGEGLSIVFNKHAKTASINLKTRTITLPELDLADPQVDWNLAHEVGHAIFTDNDKYVAAIKEMNDSNVFAAYLNIVEDARIERKILARYPGLKKTNWDGSLLDVEDDFFGIKGKDLTQYPLVDRLNLAAKIGGIIDLHLSDTEHQWYSRMMETDTLDDVIRLTKELYTSEKAKGNIIGVPMLGMGTGGNPQQGQSGPPSGPQMEQQGHGQGQGQGNPQQGQQTQGNNGSLTLQNGPHGQTPGQGQQEAPMPTTQEHYNQKMAQHGGTPSDHTTREGTPVEDNVTQQSANKPLPYGGQGSAVFMVDPMKLPIDRIVKGHTTILPLVSELAVSAFKTEFTNYRSSLQPVVNGFVMEFQRKQRAALRLRVQQSKTGMVDGRRLHAYKVSDAMFACKMTLPKGKNHAFKLVVDWSSSMNSHMRGVIEQVMVFVDVARKLHIPVDIYCFSDAASSGWSLPSIDGEITVTGHNLLHVYSSRWSQRIQQDMLLRFYCMCLHSSVIPSGLGRSGTPLYHCMPSVARIVREDTISYKVERMITVVITDGDSNGVQVCGGRTWDGETLQDTRMRTWYRHEHNSVNLANWYRDYTGSTLVTIRLFNEHEFRPDRIARSFISPKERVTHDTASRWTNDMRDNGFALIDMSTGMNALFAVRGGLALSATSRADASMRPLDAAVAKKGSRKFTEQLTRFIG